MTCLQPSWAGTRDYDGPGHREDCALSVLEHFSYVFEVQSRIEKHIGAYVLLGGK